MAASVASLGAADIPQELLEEALREGFKEAERNRAYESIIGKANQPLQTNQNSVQYARYFYNLKIHFSLYQVPIGSSNFFLLNFEIYILLERYFNLLGTVLEVLFFRLVYTST